MFFLKTTLVFALGWALLFFFCPSAYSEIFRYKDEKGVWHFSNIRSNRHYKPYRTYANKKMTKPSYRRRLAEYSEYITLASRLFSVEQPLIKAIIKAESNFDHRAVSSKGAQGLMQLMPNTVNEMDVRNPFDPKENIIGGTKYISLLLKRFNNNKTLALAAYNAGPTAVEARKGIPPFPETRTYIKKVLRYYEHYNGGAE